MKALTIILTVTALIFVNYLMAQNDEGKRIEFQIKERTSFYTVDDRYNLLTDTIYHADDGFRVFSGYDIITCQDGKEYVILRYPNWARNKKGKVDQIHPQKKLVLTDEQEKMLFAYVEAAIKKYSVSKDTNFIKSSVGLNTILIVISRGVAHILDSIKGLSKKEELDKPVHVDIVGRNGLKLAVPKEQFDKLKLEGKIDDVYSLKWKYSTRLATGIMTVPFKFRPKQDSVNFNMTTDVTLGAYIGVKKRISRKGNNFIVLPFTLGLSYINVGNNETSNVNTEGNSSVVPGWTWSTGLVFDLGGFNLGLVLGQDFASGVGKNWLYNKKIWYSFSIGYGFFSKSGK